MTETSKKKRISHKEKRKIHTEQRTLLQYLRYHTYINIASTSQIVKYARADSLTHQTYSFFLLHKHPQSHSSKYQCNIYINRSQQLNLRAKAISFLQHNYYPIKQHTTYCQAFTVLRLKNSHCRE